MNDFIKLNENERVNKINEVRLKLDLSDVAIEKDWWVTAVLRALFALPYAKNLSFKGGTSLSKCYNLIQRFSEDIDIAVNREYLGFSGNLSKNQINDKLRRAACSFVRENLQFDVANMLNIQGISKDLFRVIVNITPVSTTDPEIIEIHYKSLHPDNNYLKPLVKIEVSGRSMNEPLKKVDLQSIIDEELSNATFVDKPFSVNAVVPERTFIEKICLLHEEFAKPKDLIRVERMSRHLYDLVKMMESSVMDNALKNKELYQSVIEHRRLFVGLKDFDYDTLEPKYINIIPPDEVINNWKHDYEIMRDSMIYGDSLPFNKLIGKLKELNQKINNIC